jgi:hypothetical protein
MAYLVSNEYGLRPTSSRVTVPNNDVARLMYYLHCVFHVIEYNDQDVRRYRDYHNWSLLSDAEQRVVFLLALTFNPDELDGKVFFHSDELCGDWGSKCFELSEVRHQLLAVQSIVVAGRTRQVKQIMTYKKTCIQYYYTDPVKRLTHFFNQQRQAAAARARAVTARSARPTYVYPKPTSDVCVIS